MKILGVIPARGGSKGILGKNIKLLGGKPLLGYTIDSVVESKLLTKCILSSDSEEIIKAGKRLGVEIPFIRPAEFAKDETPSIEVIKHALEFFAASNEYFDTVCLLQPTTPFRRDGLIDDAIKKFDSGSYDSLVSVRKVPHQYNPHWVFEEKKGKLEIATGEKEIISRRQELPKAYHRDGAIYLTKTEVILNSNSLLGNKIGFIDTTDEDYVNLDSMEDWKKAEEILKKRS
ncbi:acylneuraminate cytidylyltransferase family protein [Gramella sp. MAR_2010_147]|uniref:acylneuraminate cytidylyltransferase family protein n=1 Tax=Gramella sp. MAR_2010_147 TaxID=1250205 RepID=UPI00087B561F|nr:acylneuraminate cytidylyltransferase family protein [Gramella sp. MAR_2010_147]SDS01213.1 N-acylneuraminate cytidylyltransferase [Gramella sp. MAR_2010_147]